jgi:short-subunit dehydrogenase
MRGGDFIYIFVLSKSMSFKNKTIWITGASSGIGRALTLALSDRGAKLIISSRRKEALENVKKQCGDTQNIRVLPLDLSKPETFSAKVQEAQQLFGPVDMLFNNGGISQRSLALETDMATIREIMEVNFFGTVALTKAVLPGMIKRQHGHIVITSSVMGKFGTRMRSAYSASKHALHGWFDSLRQEVYASNVKITLVCPGFVKTNVTINALRGDGSTFGKMAPGQKNGMSPARCARKMLAGIEKGKDEIYIGGKEILAIYLNRMAPRLFRAVLQKADVT